MISATPSVFDVAVSQSGSGIDPFVDRHAPDSTHTYYGAGKVALRDGLAGLVDSGENVLVPAYLSPAVVEPFHDLGLESRFYAVEETLAPDFADLESRIDDDTAAVMSVNYFGFPQPGLERIASLSDEYDCYHVDDNAHSPLSVCDGTLLGTHGDLGITTLRKLLPVPDGALLYCTDDEVKSQFSPSSLAGRSGRIAAGDCRFVAASVAERVLETSPSLHRSVEAVLSDGAEDSSSVDPSGRYEAAKVPMSRFSAAVADAADPDAIRAARRENFRAWQEIVDGRNDLTPLFKRLPAGISPYEFPVRTSESEAFLAELEDCGVVGAHTWPILRQNVREDETYETSIRLADELVALPVHQGIEPSAIETVGDRLRR
ncbi:DegT/DnrJ/EryC1/StrS family aminotransferase [Natrinema versiforme]|uniref:DegT/DnrJ/EryC1/StrS aminotransferase family protein n=1 Tax=Natrinema versiforme TaxID=88724 RepID=A0A4P8WFR7_9EURY|nr:DegT/DnrJ/EryC1/StrS family aminotransferase [Natrinema versiforme]QCS42100.1 DegT/DnrJ/EryC1/StrS aminotransferase family protein [Natrinema versiforme]